MIYFEVLLYWGIGVAVEEWWGVCYFSVFKCWVALWVVKAVARAAADAAENPALNAAHEAAFHTIIIGSRFL